MTVFRIMLLDVKLLLKDRTFYIKLLFFPLLLIAILGMIFQSSGSAKIAPFTIAYYNEDAPSASLSGTSLGLMFETNVLKSGSVQGTIEIAEVSGKVQAEELLKSGKASAYLHVPSGLTQSWLDGKAATIEQDTSGASTVQEELITQLENGFFHVLNTKQVLEKAVVSTAQTTHASPAALRKALSQIAGSGAADVSIPEQTPRTGRHPITSMQYYAVGMMLMFSILTAFLLIHSVVEERLNGTFGRIFSTPLQSIQYLAGKLLGIALSVMVQMGILMVFTSLFYRVDWGPVLSVLLITVLYGFTVSAFILLLGLRAKSQTSVSSYSSLILYGFSFLGGSFVSADAFPPTLQKLHTLIPNGAALDAYLAVSNGKSIRDIAGSLLCIAGYAVVFLLLCFITLNRKGEVFHATAHTAANAA